MLKQVGVALMKQHQHPEISSKYFMYMDRNRRYINVSDGMCELFKWRRGEILGVSGLIGSGRTEVGKCLFGLTKANRGHVSIDGRNVVHRGPADAIRNGLVYLPEERKKEGIFPLLSVRENLCIAGFEHRDQHTAVPVLSHNVGLKCRPTAYSGHVA